MQPLRLLVAGRRGWFVVLLACAMAARLLVPAGFMPVVVAGVVTLQPCSGVMPAEAAGEPAVASDAMASMPGMAAGSHDDGHHPDEPRVEMPCSFAGIGPAALGAAPPLLLAAALAFVFLAVLRLTAQALPAPPRLRPPLRAPPLSI